MSERQSHAAFLSSLLAQDRGITSEQIKEFRMQLQAALEHAERTERWFRKGHWIAALCALFIGFSALPLIAWELMHYPVVQCLWARALGLSLVVAVGLTLLDNEKFRPDGDGARGE